MTKNEGGAEEDVILEDLPQIEEGAEDKTDYKALAIKNHGIAKRYQTKLAKQKETKVPEGGEGGDGKGGKGNDDQGSGLDKLDRAVLRLEKITEPDEVKLVETWMKETGKDIEGVIGSKYFQAELKEMREIAASTDATPEGGNRRSGAQAKDSVEYWLARTDGKLPDDPALRTKVVNAKIAKEKNQSQFSPNPIQ